jgi:hypothetical protein
MQSQQRTPRTSPRNYTRMSYREDAKRKLLFGQSWPAPGEASPGADDRRFMEGWGYTLVYYFDVDGEIRNGFFLVSDAFASIKGLSSKALPGTMGPGRDPGTVLKPSEGDEGSPSL